MIKSVNELTSRDVRKISFVLISVENPPKMSLRVFNAITNSSSAAFPARSPMPLTVQCTCRAPASTADKELAVDIPRSSWQWMEMIAFEIFGTFARISVIREVISCG